MTDLVYQRTGVHNCWTITQIEFFKAKNPSIVSRPEFNIFKNFFQIHNFTIIDFFGWANMFMK